MLTPGRSFSAGSSYRYGFNGKESDGEVKGEGNQQDYGFRIYDPRLGRFLSVDPLTKQYPQLTPYQFSSNNPILNIDVDGLEGNDYTGKFVNATPEQRKEYPVWSFFKDLSADVLNASPFGVADNMIATWNQSSNAERTYNVLMTLTAPLSPLKPGEARPTSLKPVPGETINIRPVVNKATTETPVNSTGKQAVTANGSSAEAVKSNAANSTSIKTPSNPVNGQKGTSTNYRDVFFKANPKLKGEVIVHHAVEQQVLKRYPGVFTESEINSLQNLRGIPLDKNSDVHLSQIRKEWNEFYRNNPKATKQNILDKAADIDKMFGGQFNPTR